ncbi:hypothetical protein AB0F39_11855 [Streptomyces murinus]|uniref:hypothetical protein n=1 Tax=Streptomyces murinus TaxID=33900 RepID=UPI0033DF9F50
MPNPRYGPPEDDFAELTESLHWLDWLGEQPAVAVRESIAGILDERSPARYWSGSRSSTLRATSLGAAPSRATRTG